MLFVKKKKKEEKVACSFTVSNHIQSNAKKKKKGQD
jgi:hypothetical protein